MKKLLLRTGILFAFAVTIGCGDSFEAAGKNTSGLTDAVQRSAVQQTVLGYLDEISCYMAAVSGTSPKASVSNSCGGGGPGTGTNPGGTTPSCNAPAGYTKIYTAQDLSNIRNNMTGKYFLCNDIYLSEEFVPIGTSDSQPFGEYFGGTLDGNNRTIHDLHLKLQWTSDWRRNWGLGFIKVIDSTGIVKNLRLKNVEMGAATYNGFQSVGSLAGVNFGVIDHVSIIGTGHITPSLYGNEVYGLGGLVGSHSGIIRNASISGTYTIYGKESVGGLVGGAGPGGTLSLGLVENVSVDGQIEVQGSGWEWGRGTGGIVGTLGQGKLVNGRVSESVAVYDFGRSGYAGHAGGLVGALHGCIENSFSLTSNIAAPNTGGLVGFMGSDSACIKNSFAKANLWGGSWWQSSTVGGLVGWGWDGTVEDSYFIGSILLDLPYGNPDSPLLGGAGGIVGGLDYMDIVNTYSSASIATNCGEGTVCRKGGISGSPWTYSNPWPSIGTISASFFNHDLATDLPFDDGDGNIGKTAAELKTLNTFFPDWDISYIEDVAQTTWKIASPDGTDFPQLAWELQ